MKLENLLKVLASNDGMDAEFIGSSNDEQPKRNKVPIDCFTDKPMHIEESTDSLDCQFCQKPESYFHSSNALPDSHIPYDTPGSLNSHDSLRPLT